MCSREACQAGRLCDREGAKDVASVVREIERKYDFAAGGTAALDAAQAMTGTAGVAAVARQDEQFLDAVYYDTADLRLDRVGRALAEITATRLPRALAGRLPAAGAAPEPPLTRYSPAGEVVLAYARPGGRDREPPGLV